MGVVSLLGMVSTLGNLSSIILLLLLWLQIKELGDELIVFFLHLQMHSLQIYIRCFGGACDYFSKGAGHDVPQGL